MSAVPNSCDIPAGTLWRLDDVVLDGHCRRLDHVQLEIPAGITAVLGPSGSGKTSLLNLLVDFERPTRGTIRPVLAGGPGATIGWVPQVYSLWPHLDVEQHIRTVSPLHRRGRDDVQQWLERFGLGPLRSAYPQHLSAGQQSRLSVARALASEARILVMDEPFANVDVTQEPAYWEEIASHVATGRSLVFTSHRLEAVYRLAEYIVGLRDGKVVYRGRLSELYAHPQSKEQASLLGHVNCFEGDRWWPWFTDPPPGGGWVRPEQLAVERVLASPVRVECWRFLGQIAMVQLGHADTGAELTVCCAPGAPLLPGQCVRLRIRSVGYPRPEDGDTLDVQ